MLIAGKYEVSDIVADGEVRTRVGRHAVLGHPLMVHFFTVPSSQTGVLDRLASLPHKDQELFIDAGEYDGSPFLVSRILPGFSSLGEWLQRRIKTEPPPSSQTCDDFERLFAVREQQGAAHSPAASVSLRGRSEFSQLFRKSGSNLISAVKTTFSALARERKAAQSSPAPAGRSALDGAVSSGRHEGLTMFFHRTSDKLFRTQPRPAVPVERKLPEATVHAQDAPPGSYTRVVLSKPAAPAESSEPPAAGTATAQPEAAPATMRRYVPLFIGLVALAAAAVAVSVILSR